MSDAGEASLALALFGAVLMVAAAYTAWTVDIGKGVGRAEVCAEVCGPYYSTTEPDALCLCLEVAP